MKTIRFPFPKHLNDTGPGRTIREATEDGTYFTLAVGGRTVCHGFPGVRTVRDALRAAVWNRMILSGDLVEVSRYLPGSTIGCAFVEPVETVLVEVTEPERSVAA